MDTYLHFLLYFILFVCLNFISSLLKQSNVCGFIDLTLGFRNYRSKYAYSDIVLSLLKNSLCIGEFVSDLKHLKEQIAENMKDSIPSHDTVEYAFQELKIPNKIIITENNITHQINYNKNINNLLTGICTKLGLLNPDVKD